MRSLRAEFLRMLTEDGPTNDRRRKEFNMALFDGEKGYCIWTSIDLDQVMAKFDKAAGRLGLK